MPSTDYRYFCLDSTGKLHDTQWFNAADDEDAVAYVKAKHPDAKCEVWQDKRLVAKLGFGSSIQQTLTSSARCLEGARQALRDTAGLVDGHHRSA